MRRTPYLDTFRAKFGRAHKISRAQLQGFLLYLANDAGLDLRGYAGWYGVMDTDSLELIARAVANAPHELTLLSLGGHVRDIQYDQPGSMNPSQQAELSFVSMELSKGDYDYDRNSDPGSTMAYLRTHAKRVVVVTGPQIPIKAAVPPEPDYWDVSCDAGHCWRVPRAEHPEEQDRCPVCGDYWQ